LRSSNTQLFRQHRREEGYRSLLVRLFVLLEAHQSSGLDADAYRDACREFLGELEQILDQEGSLLIAEREGHLYFNGVRAHIDLAGFTALKFLVRTLLGRGLSGFLLMQGVSDDELYHFFEVLLAQVTVYGEELCTMLEERGVQSVQPVLTVDGELADVLGARVEMSGRPTSYFKSIFLLRHLLSGLEGSLLVDFAEAKELLHGIVEFVLEEDGILLALDKLKRCDMAVFRHSVESAVLALELGRDLELENPALLRLGVCALLHDFAHRGVDHPSRSSLSFQEIMAGSGFSELVLECAIVAHAHDSLGELDTQLNSETLLFARIVHCAESFARIVTRGRRYGLRPERILNRLQVDPKDRPLRRALSELARRLSARAPQRRRDLGRRSSGRRDFARRTPSGRDHAPRRAGTNAGALRVPAP
jgi:hypothetical protein